MSRQAGRSPSLRVLPFLIVSALVLVGALLGGKCGSHRALAISIGEILTIPSGWFIALFISLFGLSLAAVLLFPRGLSVKRAAVVVVVLSLAARVLLLPHPASDDVNRYLWEGRILAHGFSPYSHSPQADHDPEVDSFRDPSDPIWRGINHPTYTAIYPPMLLVLFAGVASISYTPLAVKLVVVAFDLSTLVMLLLLLERRRIDPRWALLYGLSPVALFAFAGEGHNDAVQLFFVVLALHLSQKQRWTWAWVFLGLAVQAKVIALLLWPFFVSRESWRRSWAGIVVAIGPALPFLIHDQGALFESFFAFGYDMAFNGPAHMMLRGLVGSPQQATVLCQLCFGVVFLSGLSLFHPGRKKGRTVDATSGVFFTLGAMLLLSPTVHFWYLSWLLPFLVLRPTASWLVLTATIAFAFVPYGLEQTTGIWSFPWWGPWSVWAVPVLMMIRDLRLAVSRLRFERRQQKEPQRPRTVSVVVPTLDEASRLLPCLEPLLDDPIVTEVIVVDGGSTDGTRTLAQEAGAVVIEHEAPFDRGGGRGGQIAAGLERATGDVMAVVHADTVLMSGTFERVIQRLACNPEVVGGAVGAVFAGRGVTLRAIELANDFRAAFLGIGFGDQVQFFRRELFDEGCFPNIPLMEDVELSLRLHGLGRACFLWGECLVSPRRWQRGDTAKRVWLVIALTAEYLIRRVLGPADTVSMYRRYYGVMPRSTTSPERPR